MSDKLKPCPFCGGEAHVVIGEYAAFEDGYAVQCDNCCLTFGAYGRLGETYQWSCIYPTETEAVSAWNARAELECEWKRANQWRNAEGDDYVYGYETACGARHTWWPDSMPAYCPSCGGKVVGA